ncbi:PetM family cytochrome b6-f complex subunit 7 [Tumidithrix helvetica PCC 7403]
MGEMFNAAILPIVLTLVGISLGYFLLKLQGAK